MMRENDGRTALLELSFAFMGCSSCSAWRPACSGVGACRRGRCAASAWWRPPARCWWRKTDTRPIGAAGLAAISALLLAVELRDRETDWCCRGWS